MQIAAGNDVRGVGSETNPVTSEITLLPHTIVNGVEVVINEVAPNPNVIALIALVFVQVVFVTMVYGPIAAYLVEAFPAKVRYTSMSLPYHIGNGVFGGLLPLIGLSICAATGSIFAGLAYPIIIALITFVVGTRFLPETRHVRIWDELEPDTVPDDASAAPAPEAAASAPAVTARDVPDGAVTAP
jgi:MFS family permease